MPESCSLSILNPQTARRSLTFNEKFVIAIVGIITAPIVLVLVYLVATGEIERKISGPVTVGPEWIEIRLDKPLKVSRRTQSILLYVSDKHESYDEHNDASGNSAAMRFPDGSIVRPEVQILDEYGTVYNLDAIGFLSKDRTSGELNAGLSFSTDFNPAIDSNFPNDRVYPLIRVRSAKAIHVSEIVWYCNTGK